MKTLYIVRHAKSSWDNPELSDFDRPLNGRGKRDAPEMGKRLKLRGIKPKIIISSPAKRAFTTAKKIASEIDFSLKSIITDKRLYHAGYAQICNVINEVDAEDSLMIFGHNPGFTDFVNRICNARIDNLPTCGIVSVNFEMEDWSRIQTTTGNFVFFDYPKNISGTTYQ